MRWISVLVAIGVFAVCSYLMDVKADLSLIIFSSALGWLFLVIAIGGRKGFAVGVGIMVFAGCVRLLFPLLAKVNSNSRFLSYNLGPDQLFFWLGILAGACLVLVIPSVITVKLWKRAGQKKTAKEKKEKEEKKTSGWRDFKVKY